MNKFITLRYQFLPKCQISEAADKINEKTHPLVALCCIRDYPNCIACFHIIYRIFNETNLSNLTHIVPPFCKDNLSNMGWNIRHNWDKDPFIYSKSLSLMCSFPEFSLLP